MNIKALHSLCHIEICVCRRLAEVSRLTRGVVVLICDIHYAELVMVEAKRLNMLDGHFFWLWIDASKELDVFHTVSNKIENADDIQEDFNGFNYKDEVLRPKPTERRKRDDADNNSVNDLKRLNITKQLESNSKEELYKNTEYSVINSSIKSNFRRNGRNTIKPEAHNVDNKLLNINFSQEFDSSRNISSENVSNYDYVNNKGVETSKIGKNSIEKGKMTFLYRDSSRRTSYNKTKNESFNKYVNSINVESINAEKSYLKQEDVVDYSDESSNLKDSLLSSDISGFLMNPAVHMAKMHNIRDTVDKRINNDFAKNTANSEKDNITVIINNLPVGLLALHPQPMKIGKYAFYL